MCSHWVPIVLIEVLEEGRSALEKPNINRKETNHTLVKATVLMLVNFLGLVWLNPRHRSVLHLKVC